MLLFIPFICRFLFSYLEQKESRRSALRTVEILSLWEGRLNFYGIVISQVIVATITSDAILLGCRVIMVEFPKRSTGYCKYIQDWEEFLHKNENLDQISMN